MSVKYVAFDVETPNSLNNRICSIGITTIDHTGRYETEGPKVYYDHFIHLQEGVKPYQILWAEESPKDRKMLEDHLRKHYGYDR